MCRYGWQEGARYSVRTDHWGRQVVTVEQVKEFCAEITAVLADGGRITEPEAVWVCRAPVLILERG